MLLFGDNKKEFETNKVLLMSTINLLLLGEEPTDYVNGSVGSAEQKFHINFRKEKTHFF